MNIIIGSSKSIWGDAGRSDGDGEEVSSPSSWRERVGQFDAEML